MRYLYNQVLPAIVQVSFLEGRSEKEFYKNKMDFENKYGHGTYAFQNYKEYCNFNTEKDVKTVNIPRKLNLCTISDVCGYLRDNNYSPMELTMTVVYDSLEVW